MRRHRAYIGLGANLDQPLAQLTTAVAALAALPGCTLRGVSALYGSSPVGPQDQPDYLNAAACLSTELTPHQLLAALQGIENAHGRLRLQRWGARTLDLDLLLFGADEIRTPDLVVPHPELVNRAFVVRPLLDLDPELALPDGLALKTLTSSLASQGLELLDAGPWWQNTGAPTGQP